MNSYITDTTRLPDRHRQLADEVADKARKPFKLLAEATAEVDRLTEVYSANFEDGVADLLIAAQKRWIVQRVFEAIRSAGREGGGEN